MVWFSIGVVSRPGGTHIRHSLLRGGAGYSAASFYRKLTGNGR